LFTSYPNPGRIFSTFSDQKEKLFFLTGRPDMIVAVTIEESQHEA